MGTDEEKDFLDKSAKTISVIFHPLLMPLYGMIIIFSGPTLLGYLPFNFKKLLFLIVLINNVLLPLSIIPFFIYKNIISSWTIENRQERIIPLLLTTLLYASTSFIIFRFPIPLFLKSFLLAAFFISLAVTVINFWWKISIHSVGAGALTALVLILSFKLDSSLVWYLISVIMISGLVLSSRLRLNAHNPSQVWSGYLIGCLGLGLFSWFF
ncbi:MAG: phosphatase PAP2 family protein [Bacteroidales bacterium]|nr:phosphatase PAP2 family protein [Bacteroidales bacterium]